MKNDSKNRFRTKINQVFLENGLVELKSQKNQDFFRRCRWPPRVDKLFISSTPSPAVYDKQSMYDEQTFHKEYSVFDAKIHEKSISVTEKSTFH